MSDDALPTLLGPRRPDWSQLYHLVDGARQRGFTPAQVEYLEACIGCAFAKGREAGAREATKEVPRG